MACVKTAEMNMKDNKKIIFISFIAVLSIGIYLSLSNKKHCNNPVKESINQNKKAEIDSSGEKRIEKKENKKTLEAGSKTVKKIQNDKTKEIEVFLKGLKNDNQSCSKLDKSVDCK